MSSESKKASHVAFNHTIRRKPTIRNYITRPIIELLGRQRTRDGSEKSEKPEGIAGSRSSRGPQRLQPCEENPRNAMDSPRPDPAIITAAATARRRCRSPAPCTLAATSDSPSQSGAVQNTAQAPRQGTSNTIGRRKIDVLDKTLSPEERAVVDSIRYDPVTSANTAKNSIGPSASYWRWLPEQSPLQRRLTGGIPTRTPNDLTYDQLARRHSESRRARSVPGKHVRFRSLVAVTEFEVDDDWSTVNEQPEQGDEEYEQAVRIYSRSIVASTLLYC